MPKKSLKEKAKGLFKKKKPEEKERKAVAMSRTAQLLDNQFQEDTFEFIYNETGYVCPDFEGGMDMDFENPQPMYQ